jgi:hypothetical protein
LVHLLSGLMNSPAARALLGRNAQRTVVERNLTWRTNAARAVALLRGQREDLNRLGWRTPEAGQLDAPM